MYIITEEVSGDELMVEEEYYDMDGALVSSETHKEPKPSWAY